MANVFTWPIRVYYEDTDAGGIVYYANYLKFLERARTEWLRSLGIEQDTWLAHNLGFVVRQVGMDLIRPAKFNDMLTVASRMVKVGRASVVFAQEIRNAAGELLCEAEIKAACVQLGSDVKAVPMPSEILEGLKRAN